jgi:hypothetical protein
MEEKCGRNAEQRQKTEQAKVVDLGEQRCLLHKALVHHTQCAVLCSDGIGAGPVILPAKFEASSTQGVGEN